MDSRMTRAARTVALAGIVMMVSAASGAVQAPPPGRTLPDFDIRQPAGNPSLSGRAQVSDRETIRMLEDKAGSRLRVRRDQASGALRWIHAFGRPLSDVTGAAAESAARQFLAGQPGRFGFAPQGEGELALSFVEDSDSGATHVGFTRLIDGLPVMGGDLRVDLDRQGRIIAVDLAQSRPGLSLKAAPVLSAFQATKNALYALGVAGDLREGPQNRAARVQEFTSAGMRSAIHTDLVWFPSGTGARLAWHVLAEPGGYPAYYRILIDAQTGELLYRDNIMSYADTRAEVFTDSPARGARTIEMVFDDEINVNALHPLGWLWSDSTSGNAVYAQDDRAADNETTPGAMPTATAGVPQIFSPAFTADPFADLELGVVNLFWAINRAHDYFYRIGFTESAGNFQADNLGRGGVGGDAVLGDAQDGADTLLDADPGNDISNNANFMTLRDGNLGRMQMFLWDNPAPARDGDLDVDVVFHEFCHGVSNRLVGGRGDSSCLSDVQGGAMGEGWSDFFAGSFFDDPVLAEYASQDFSKGLRTAALNADTYTYDDLCKVINGCEVHADGEIWAQNLWELRSSFIDLYGFNEGREAVERIIVDGMKFSPCSPSYLDVRDAMLMADQVRNAGAHECLIWQVFASNAMGADAADATNNDRTLPVAGFQLPAQCDPAAGLGQIGWHFSQIGCEASARITVADGDLQLPVSVQIGTDALDALALPLEESPSGPPVFMTAPFPVRGVPDPSFVDPADSILQAVRGDTLTASYLDGTDGSTREATSSLVCLADVRLVRYKIADASCDADRPANFPDLPGFLDAGESAVLEVELTNAHPFALEDVQLTPVSADPAKVKVSPAAGISVASIEPATGSHASSCLVRFLVSADPSVNAGDQVDVTVNLSALGYDDALSPITIPLTLQQDYRVTTQVLAEDFELTSPTVANWTHAPTRATPQGDEWQLVTCDPPSPTRAYKNGGGDPDCGDYSDDQGDPYLASPAVLIRPPGRVAAKPTRLIFDHHVQLAEPIDPVGACDAEAVAVFLTNDPAALDTSDPFALLDLAIDGYTVVPALGIDDRTTGFENKDLDLSGMGFDSVDFRQDAFLTWVFAADVSNVFNSMCRFFDVQGEGYYLDDVQFEWEEVDVVPQALACNQPSCKVLPVAKPAVATFCPGESVPLSGADSLSINCSGTISYRWSGGELGAGVFDPNPDIIVNPASSTEYMLEVQCSDDPIACTGSLSVVASSLSRPPVGGPIGNALFVVKSGGVLAFDWSSRVLEPRSYVIFRTDTAANTSDGAIGSQPEAARVDDGEVSDLSPPAGDLWFFEVYGRDRCTGQGYIP